MYFLEKTQEAHELRQKIVRLAESTEVANFLLASRMVGKTWHSDFDSIKFYKDVALEIAEIYEFDTLFSEWCKSDFLQKRATFALKLLRGNNKVLLYFYFGENGIDRAYFFSLQWCKDMNDFLDTMPSTGINIMFNVCFLPYDSDLKEKGWKKRAKEFAINKEQFHALKQVAQSICPRIMSFEAVESKHILNIQIHFNSSKWSYETIHG